jgi:exodeoxyribonuclease-3
VFDGAAQFSKPLTVYSFYVPAGGDEPDPSVNGKFAHKLAFLDELARCSVSRISAADERALLVGDLNVAPLEHDAWSHKHLLKWTRPSDHVPVLATFEL